MIADDNNPPQKINLFQCILFYQRFWIISAFLKLVKFRVKNGIFLNFDFIDYVIILQTPSPHYQA